MDQSATAQLVTHTDVLRKGTEGSFPAQQPRRRRAKRTLRLSLWPVIPPLLTCKGDGTDEAMTS